MTSDHHYVFQAQPATLIDDQIRAAEEIGISPRNKRSMSADMGGLPQWRLFKLKKLFLLTVRLINKYHDNSPFSMLRIALPLFPFSVTRELMLQTKIWQERKELVSIHTAETLDEEKFCLERYGRRPWAHGRVGMVMMYGLPMVFLNDVK